MNMLLHSSFQYLLMTLVFGCYIGFIVERKSAVVAMVFLSDRGQKIVSPYRGWLIQYIVAQAPLSGYISYTMGNTSIFITSMSQWCAWISLAN